ncbi:hypothetical protein [Acidisoma sp. 7E03]
MQPIRALLLAGAVTAGATALAGYAHAGQDGMQTLILQLPGGGVEQVQAVVAAPATVPQQIVLVPAPAGMPVPMPMPVALLAPPPVAAVSGDPFAQMDRISAIMNAQAAAMMNAMTAMMSQPVPTPSALVPARFAALPPGGSASYAVISTAAGRQGACMESVQITMGAPGQAPQVLSHRAGTCGGGALPFGQTPTAAPLPQAPAGTPALVPAVQQPVASPPAEVPHLIRARADLPVSLPQPART